MDRDHYVPILLTRRGERTALQNTPDHIHDAMTPLFVVHPVDWNYDEERPAKTVTQHLAQLPAALNAARGGRESIVDLLLLDDDADLDNGEHPLVWLTGQCESPLIPAVSIARSDEYKAAAGEVVARDGHGACLRMQTDEWPSSIGTDLDDLLAELEISPGEVDLLLDLGDRTDDLARTAARLEVASLPYLDDWRSVVIVGTAMPKEMPGKGVNIIERGEWALYQSILAHGVPRVPTFGDYAIAHPDPTFDVPPQWMSISASIRYTSDDEWVVVKGELYKGKAGTGIGGLAVPPVLATLRNQPQYLGSGHCGLETWVDAVINDGVSGGRPEEWRRYGTQHHLQFVTNQLSNLHDV